MRSEYSHTPAHGPLSTDFGPKLVFGASPHYRWPGGGPKPRYRWHSSFEGFYNKNALEDHSELEQKNYSMVSFLQITSSQKSKLDVIFLLADMEAIPSLNTFQMALLPDPCPDAEEELIQVLTQLLITAIGK